MEIVNDFNKREKKASQFRIQAKKVSHDASTIKIINNFTNFHTNKNNFQNCLKEKKENIIKNLSNINNNEHQRSLSYNSEGLKHSKINKADNLKMWKDYSNSHILPDLNKEKEEDCQSDDSLKLNKHTDPKITIETFKVKDTNISCEKEDEEEINFEDLIEIKTKTKTKIELSIAFEFI